jgi:hypothetical protein
LITTGGSGGRGPREDSFSSESMDETMTVLDELGLVSRRNGFSTGDEIANRDDRGLLDVDVCVDDTSSLTAP